MISRASSRLACPDDNMSPRIKTGHILTLDTDWRNRRAPRDAVLVADADNVHRLRIYRERRRALGGLCLAQ